MHPVKLRGHHLLCILSYIGLGYTKNFTQIFDRAVDQISKGAEIIIVSGLDDICSSLQGDEASFCEHAPVCLRDSVKKRDAMALLSVRKVLHAKSLSIGSSFCLGSQDAALLREGFRSGVIRTACHGCEWYETCTDIASKNFAETKLFQE